MKKLILTLLLALALAPQVWAASSVVFTMPFKSSEVVVVQAAWTAHTDGSFTSAALPTWITDFLKGRYFLFAMVTDPGTTAPTADYDITVTDSDSLDILTGDGANRHTSSTEIAYPLIGTLPVLVPVTGALTLNISGNSQNGAVGVIKLYFVKRQP